MRKYNLETRGGTMSNEEKGRKNNKRSQKKNLTRKTMGHCTPEIVKN